MKLNNVVFESPLLLYATGNHFQSVMQEDHEYFINLAKELELNNDVANNQSGIPASTGKEYAMDSVTISASSRLATVVAATTGLTRAATNPSRTATMSSSR